MKSQIGGAISIYITEFKSVLPQNNSPKSNISQTPQKTQILQSTQPPRPQAIRTQIYAISQVLTSIKTKIFVYVGLLVVAIFLGVLASEFSNSWDSTKRDFGAILALIAICCGISALIVLYFAMRSMWQVAKSRILKISIHTFIITLPVTVLLGAILGVLINEMFFIVILFGGLIYSFILSYRIHKEVAYIANQPLFMWAFWLSIVIGILSVIAEHNELLGVAISLSLIPEIIYIVASINIRVIRISTSAKKYK